MHLSANLHGTLGCLNKHALPLVHLGKNRQITSAGASCETNGVEAVAVEGVAAVGAVDVVAVDGARTGTTAVASGVGAPTGAAGESAEEGETEAVAAAAFAAAKAGLM